jgi:hypothetical protein
MGEPSISRMIHGPVTLAIPELISGCPMVTPAWRRPVQDQLGKHRSDARPELETVTTISA